MVVGCCGGCGEDAVVVVPLVVGSVEGFESLVVGGGGVVMVVVVVEA